MPVMPSARPSCPSTWPQAYSVPSIGTTADYSVYTYTYEVPLQPVQVELEK